MTVSTMNDFDLSQLQDQISRLAKNLKSEKDLGNLTQQLVKMTIEAAACCQPAHLAPKQERCRSSVREPGKMTPGPNNPGACQPCPAGIG